MPFDHDIFPANAKACDTLPHDWSLQHTQQGEVMQKNNLVLGLKLNPQDGEVTFKV